MLANSVIALSALASIANAATHTVMVGGGGLIYAPSELTAAVGDTVNFVFGARNHSVTQSSFAAPCVSITPGFGSGYLPTTDATMSPEYSITIQSTDPIWYFCSQAAHCQAGMVGSINAPTTGNTYAAFKTAAGMASNDAVALPASYVSSGSGAVAVGTPSNVPVGASSSSMLMTSVAAGTTSMSMAAGATMTSAAAMTTAAGTSAAAAATSAKPASANLIKVSASGLALVGLVALLL
ncbi:hypothetical protein P7C70_g1835, partial [Phenoliferia sp. Uapishka_3]